jgi:hypothetical protein
MTRSLPSFLGAVFFLTVAGCSSDGGDTPPAPEEPTFTNVVKDVITDRNCGGPLCHSLTVGGFQLGTKSALYSALVNQPASGPKCGHGLDGGGPSPYVRVVPGNPDESLLYMKLKRIQPCGDSMPNSSTQLSPDKIGLVHDWIADGAKND